jgi:ribonuclease P protein component
MLPSTQRLSRSEVTSLLLQPQLKVVFNRIGTFKYCKNPGKMAFTVVTGSKNQKKAVLRNKIRRQLYSLFRSYINENKGFSETQGILYVSKQIYELSYGDLRRYVYEILQKSLA